MASGFDYIRKANTMLQPRTPSAAAKAVEYGFLPVEALIFSANNISSLAEEPIDYDEIERVLAREDLDINTNLLLLSIFEKLIKHKDPEIALFAAESINTIEGRYNGKIEKLKKLLSEKYEVNQTRELGTLYYEVSLTNYERPTIRKFYLKESFTSYRQIELHKELTFDDVRSMVYILLELELDSQARQVIQGYSSGEVNPDLLVLEARVEFTSGNIDRTFEIFTQLNSLRKRLDEESLKMVDHWMEM